MEEVNKKCPDTVHCVFCFYYTALCTSLSEVVKWMKVCFHHKYR